MLDGKRFLKAIGINLLGAMAILVYVNLLPYGARIFGGRDWIRQYLPGGDDFLGGLLFFAFFASAPAVPLVLLFWLRRYLRVTLVATLAVTSLALLLLHGTNDLAVDAQAALTLLFIPYLVTGIAIVGAVAVAVPELIVRGLRHRARRSAALPPPGQPPADGR